MPFKLIAYYGPMFAGKTTKLIDAYNNSTYKYPCNKLVIGYSKDNRYSHDNVITTHDNRQISCIKLDTCMDAISYITADTRQIFIDESQFFSDIDKFVEYCEMLSLDSVFVSGLDLDANGNIFNTAFNKVIHNATTKTKLTATCTICYNTASMTKLINTTLNDTKILIGGSDIYKPMCVDCWNIPESNLKLLLATTTTNKP